MFENYLMLSKQTASAGSNVIPGTTISPLLWFDSMSSENLIFSGGNLVSIKSKGTNNVLATPVVPGSNATVISVNGHNALWLNGSGLTCNLSPPITGTNLTLFMIINNLQVGDMSIYQRFFSTKQSGNNDYTGAGSLTFLKHTNLNSLVANVDFYDAGTTLTNSTSLSILGIRIENSSWKTYSDGTITTFSPILNLTFNNDTLNIGWESSPGGGSVYGNNINMNLCECVVIQSAISDSEASLIINYLQTRWA